MNSIVMDAAGLSASARAPGIPRISFMGPMGIGKTTAIRALASRLEAGFARVQFTPDLLPADLTGTEVWRPQESRFEFLPGPIFHPILLADEINRAPAKVQSALLEAMGERQVTVGRETYALPALFLVMATQNPIEQEGTFPLPEAQLDRFLMRIELGYPDRNAERALLEGGGRRAHLPELAACFTPDQLAPLQKKAADVHAAPPLLDYLQALIEATRRSPRFIHGLSPRAALALLAAARAWAFIDGRNMVLPEDVQAVLPGIACHRLQLSNSSSHARPDDINALIHATALP